MAFLGSESSECVEPRVPPAVGKPPLSRLAIAALVAWVGFALMTALAVWNESRPGWKFDDPVLAITPYVPALERWNYWIWVIAWGLGVSALCVKDRAEATRMLWNSGIVSVLRGLIVAAACLGPVRGSDVNLSLDWDAGLWWKVTSQILNPLSVFFGDAAHVWLTKDTLMSGHTSSTLLLVLHTRRNPILWKVMIACHALVVASILFGHVHYSIDIVVAWVVTYATYRATRPKSIAA